MMSEKWEINEGGIWDYEEILFRTNYPVGEYDKQCRHVVKDGDNLSIPLVVIGSNQGGYDSVGMCALCVWEEVEKWKRRG